MAGKNVLTRKRIVREKSVADRGHAIYARLRRKLAGQRQGRIVAIDVHTADYEVADNALVAAAHSPPGRRGLV